MCCVLLACLAAVLPTWLACSRAWLLGSPGHRLPCRSWWPREGSGTQLTSQTCPLPSSRPSHVRRTATSSTYQLVAVLMSTLCNMWGPGLALRGPEGSMKTAVDGMKVGERHGDGFSLSLSLPPSLLLPLLLET